MLSPSRNVVTRRPGTPMTGGSGQVPLRGDVFSPCLQPTLATIAGAVRRANVRYRPEFPVISGAFKGWRNLPDRRSTRFAAVLLGFSRDRDQPMAQREAYHLCGIAHVELVLHVGLIVGDRLVGQAQNAGNLLQRVPRHEQPEHFELARG